MVERAVASTSPSVQTGSSEPLDNAILFLSWMVPILFKSGCESGCLIILNEEDAIAREVGEVAYPNEICVQALETARYLQSSKKRNSYVKISPVNRDETAAIRCGHEVWAYGGGTRSEALAVLLFLLYVTQRADKGLVHQVMEEQGEREIVGNFNTLFASWHGTAPTIELTARH